MEQLHSIEQLREKTNSGLFLLLKHSMTCPISQGGFHAFADYVATHPEQPAGYLVIQENRDFSAEVTRFANVKHESPQVLLFEDGKVVWSITHQHITVEAIENQIATFR